MQMTDSKKFKYYAFISYSHFDRSWGSWLHKRIERYRVPKQLFGATTSQNRVPRRLFPCFRDREELSTSANVDEAILTALANSRFLVVVCSPKSAQSRWVNEEILQFKRQYGDNRVLAFIVDGKPNASNIVGLESQECFPNALRYKIRPDGNLSTKRCEPLAADVRADGDGKTNALLKLLAGLLEVEYDRLKGRELIAARRRAWTFRGIAGAMTVLAMCAVMAAGLSWALKEQADRAKLAALEAETIQIVERASSLTPEVATERLLEVLPSNLESPDRPVVDDALGMLRLMLATSTDARQFEVFPSEQIMLARVSRDSQYLLSISGIVPATVTVWRIADGDVVFKKRYEQGVFDADISPDGKLVAISESLYNMPVSFEVTVDGDPSIAPSVTLFAGQETASALRFHPDGRRLAVGNTRGEIFLADLAAGSVVPGPIRGKYDRLQEIVFAADGTFLAARGYDSVAYAPVTENGFGAGRFVDIENPEALSVGKDALFVGTVSKGTASISLVNGVLKELHPKNSLLAQTVQPGGPMIFSGDDLTIKILNAEKDALIYTEQHSLGATAALAPNGRFAVISQPTLQQRGLLRLIDLAKSTARNPTYFDDHSPSASFLSSSGSKFYIGTKTGQLSEFNLATAELERTYSCECGHVMVLGADQDSTRLLVAGASGVRQLDLDTGTFGPIIPLSGKGVFWGKVTHDAQRAFLDRSPRLLLADANSGKNRILVDYTETGSFNWIGKQASTLAMANTADIAVFARDTQLWMFDAAGNTIGTSKLSSPPNLVAVSDDGTRAAVHHKDLTIAVIDIPTGNARIVASDVSHATALQFFSTSVDRILVSTLADGVKVISASTTSPARTLLLPGGESANIEALASSPDLGIVAIMPQRLRGTNIVRWDAKSLNAVGFAKFERGKVEPRIGFAIFRTDLLRVSDSLKKIIHMDVDGRVSIIPMQSNSEQEVIEKACANRTGARDRTRLKSRMHGSSSKIEKTILLIASRLGMIEKVSDSLVRHACTD